MDEVNWSCVLISTRLKTAHFGFPSFGLMDEKLEKNNKSVINWQNWENQGACYWKKQFMIDNHGGGECSKKASQVCLTTWGRAGPQTLHPSEHVLLMTLVSLQLYTEKSKHCFDLQLLEHPFEVRLYFISAHLTYAAQKFSSSRELLRVYLYFSRSRLTWQFRQDV